MAAHIIFWARIVVVICNLLAAACWIRANKPIPATGCFVVAAVFLLLLSVRT